MYRFKERPAREEGFTLIELLVVVAIIGILLAIAVPSYLGFKNAANQKAAAADVRAAIPTAEQFYADNNTYTNLDAGGPPYAALKTAYDNGLDVGLIKTYDSGATYCIQQTVGGKTSSATRGLNAVSSGKVVDTACA